MAGQLQYGMWTADASPSCSGQPHSSRWWAWDSSGNQKRQCYKAWQVQAVEGAAAEGAACGGQSLTAGLTRDFVVRGLLGPEKACLSLFQGLAAGSAC